MLIYTLLYSVFDTAILYTLNQEQQKQISVRSIILQRFTDSIRYRFASVPSSSFPLFIHYKMSTETKKKLQYIINKWCIFTSGVVTVAKLLAFVGLPTNVVASPWFTFGIGKSKIISVEVFCIDKVNIVVSVSFLTTVNCVAAADNCQWEKYVFSIATSCEVKLSTPR